MKGNSLYGKRFFSITILLVLFSLHNTLFAQKVAVVLSGGAAKGLAHVGVLKALEENEIPIDYVVGTSMGGIVAGCYAAGMSPAQIEDIVLSHEFLQWVNGQLESGFNYYFYKNENNPSFLRLNLSLDSTLNLSVNTSIANDLSLNFALAEKLAQPSAIAKNNFDSLFIPLRVVAADIFTQTQVILNKGVLSDALRATQTVPFFYNPIRVDGKYLFDGGVYNNFPVDVAQKAFSPEVIIGCNVSSKVYEEYPYGEDDKLISRSLLYMLLDKSDPTKVPSSGVYLQPNLKNFTAFDFAYAKELIDSGYAQTMRQMLEIKSKIKNRRTCESVSENRNQFNNKTHPLLIDKITFEGFNSKQQQYINRFFKGGKRPLYFSDVKEGYYRLVSDNYFNNVYPAFSFNPARKDFDFELARRPQNNFQIDFGGVIATRNISSIFLGLNYYDFNKILTHFNASFYAGNFYKSAQLKARMDIPNINRVYVEPEATFNVWDYFQGRDLIVKRYSPTVLSRIDRKMGVNIGMPVGEQYKAVLSGAFITNTDQFINSNVFLSSDTLDVLRLKGPRVGLSISTNQLNRKQYASQGHAYSFSADWFSLTESIEPGSTSILTSNQKNNHSWLRARISLEQYFKKGIYSSGYLLEGVLSNQPTFNSGYRATIINAPSFNPIQDSRTLLLTNFRAFNYVAGGWRNVFTIRKSLDFRVEGYVFKPLEAIIQGDLQSAQLSRKITHVYVAGTAGLVLHSAIGPISLSVNYYDDKKSQLGVLLHVGFLLFNKPSIE